MNIKLKDLIKDTQAEFVCYRDSDLWYKIEVNPTDADPFIFNFPVPVSDTGSGVFPAKLKSIVLMRWIRQHLEKIESGEWAEPSRNAAGLFDI